MKKEEYEKRKELIELERRAKIEVEDLKHRNNINEIEYKHKLNFDLENIHHNNEKERLRIRSNEIRKSIERKARLSGGY